MLGGQSNNGGAGFPQLTPLSCTVSGIWLQKAALGFYKFGAPSFNMYPHRLVPRGRGNRITGKMHTFRGNTGQFPKLQRSENLVKCKKAKKLVIQFHLLENNKNISSSFTREEPIIHRFLEREGIHQI